MLTRIAKDYYVAYKYFEKLLKSQIFRYRQPPKNLLLL